jgi:hypothetical protein
MSSLRQIVTSRCLAVFFLGQLALAGCSRSTSSPGPNALAQGEREITPPALAIGAKPNTPPLEIIKGDGNFGGADFGEERSCSFALRNNTQETMKLELGEKSCSCAGVRLQTTELAAGQTTEISLLWTPKAEALEPGIVRLWAELKADHLSKPIRLEATGKLEPKVQLAFPRGPLDFGKFSYDDLLNPARTLVIEIFSKHAPFQLQSVQSSLAGMQIIEPVGPLAADRILVLGAKAGYRIGVKPTAQTPHGEFNGNVRIKTNLNDRSLNVPFNGTFETSSISLSQERINLPPRIALKQGYRVPPIVVTVRYGTCKSCEVRTVSPNFLQVSVTQQSAKTWRVDVRLPATAQEIRSKLSEEEWRQLQAFGFDSGEITLQLDHPDVKQINIPISGCLLQLE